MTTTDADPAGEAFRRSAGLRESQSDLQLLDRLSAKLDKSLRGLARRADDLADPKHRPATFEVSRESRVGIVGRRHWFLQSGQMSWFPALDLIALLELTY